MEDCSIGQLTKNKIVSIVIPAYNEEARIGNMLEDYIGVLDRESDAGYELVIVCNGCTDNTYEIASGFSKKSESVRVLCFEQKLGKGGAIIEGFKVAEGALVGFMDADESTTAGEYLKIIRALEKGEVDGAIGSRRAKGAMIEIKQPLSRRVASRVFNLLVRAIFALDFTDTQCGAKVFKREAVKEVLPTLKSTGFEFDVEFLWRLRREKKRILEVPITWKHEEGSTFGLRYAPKMLFNLLRLRILR